MTVETQVDISANVPCPCPDKFLKKDDVLEATALSKSALYHRIQTKDFPKPVKLGGASVWSEKAVQAWITSKLIH
ncbi:helix-turn-helix transcriptional regulator [Pseudoxanthomonas sacheonensis]|uniref:helix-turn-helix transcriptional regulator n=1 Tax=Pseudoxanthomonas sacheonensis TaxID=443615 RepID=UPI0013D6AA58|nr:AlpA family phage regulatory protein [Pseudoxanthomonas sacheonensis]KAF1711685.1 DNA-binding protein [Pseudoxanthomonas sacheonensis]